MKYKVITILFFFTLRIISQENTLDKTDCDWFEKFKSSDNIDYRLELIKSNYIDIGQINKLDSTKCKIVYALELKNDYLLLTTDYHKIVRDPKAIIQSIISSELDTMYILEKKIAQTLYRADAIIYLKSTKKNFKEKVNKIRFRNR